MVYGYCLEVGQIYPYLESQRAIDVRSVSEEANNFEVPSTALLAVCKLVHDESEPLLYKKNTFVLPAAALSAKFFINTMHSDIRRAWIKSVELKLSPYDLSKDEKLAIFKEEQLNLQQHLVYTDWINITLDNNSSAYSVMLGWEGELHKRYKDQLRFESWPKTMSPILEHLQLDKLVVSFEESVCSFNCCSIPRSAGAAFNQGFAKGVPKLLRLENIQEPGIPRTNYKVSIKQDIQRWTADRRNTKMTLIEGVRANKKLFFDFARDDDSKDGEWA